jgi:hypothetical protein
MGLSGDRSGGQRPPRPMAKTSDTGRSTMAALECQREGARDVRPESPPPGQLPCDLALGGDGMQEFGKAHTRAVISSWNTAAAVRASAVQPTWRNSAS